MSDTPAEHKNSKRRAGEQRPWITNLVLLGVVLSLGVWIMLGEPETAPRGLAHQAGKVFPHFVASDITKIEMQRGAETLAFVRETKGADTPDPNMPTKGWRLEQPVQDGADDTNVNRLLNAVEHMRTDKGGKISEAELASYTFGETLARLTFSRPGKPPISFTVGDERAGGVMPVKNSDGNIYQVDKGFLKHVRKDLWQYRDRQILAIAKEQVTGVVMERRDALGPGDVVRKTEFVMQEGRWRLGSADGDTVSATLVEAFLKGVSYTRGAGVVADSPSPEDLRAFGLDPPKDQLTLSWPGDSSTVEFGNEIDGSPQERYARVPQRPTIVYRVNMTPFYEAFHREAGDYLHPGVFPLTGGEGSVDGIKASFADAEPFAVEKIPQEADWWFPGTDPIQLAKNDECVALVKALLELRVRDRLSKPVDEAALGVDDPELVIALRQGHAVYELHVGKAISGEPGVHNVKRKESDGSLAFYYTCDLADLPFRLRDAMLDLRHPTLFRASSWNVDAIAVLDEAGVQTFAAEKKDPSKGETPNAILKWVVEGDPRPTDDEQVTAFMKQFDDVQSEKWLALDSPEARRNYGLAPRPRKIVFRVKTLAEGGKLEETTRTLLLGERTGERIHAMAEGGPAIALIDANFLDRIARGFSRGTPLIEFKFFDVTKLVVERDGEKSASFELRPGQFWMRDGVLIIDKAKEFEDCLKRFERVTINTSEVANDKRLEATGLKSPEWKLTFTVKSQTGDPVEHTLKIGNGEGLGERNRWASSGGDTIGSWYDEPLRTVEEYLRLNPKPKAPKQPKTPDEDDHSDHDHKK